MYTIKNEVQYQLIIKKSRFICTLIPVFSLLECKEKLKDIKKKYYDATHNCYAYVIDNNIKAFDDKEPSQTAGVMILDVLNKNDLTNILAIVTRYYGGIKLGASGLRRAYSQITSDTLKEAELFLIQEMMTITIEFAYSYVNEIMRILSSYQILSSIFENTVTLKIEIPASEIENIKQHLINITKNNFKLKI